MPLRLIPREDWFAKISGDMDYLNLPVTSVFVSNTNTTVCQTLAEGKSAMRYLQRTHIQKGLRDIRYNFVIGSDGTVYEGRGWTIQPAVLKKHLSFQSVALFVTFFWKSVDGDPPDIMYEALDELVMMGVKNKFITKKFLMHHLAAI